MKKLVLLTVIFAVLISPAAADAAPVHTLTFNDEELGYAIDGTDVYVLSERTIGKNFNSSFRTSITRRSLVDPTNQKIVTFGKNVDVMNIEAAAGSAYVSTEIESFMADNEESRGTVERVSRDGSVRTVLAEGVGLTWYSYTGGAPTKSLLLRDCGKRVGFYGVSETGAAILGEDQIERASKLCGGSTNVDRWRYYTISSAGVETPIVSIDRKPTIKHCKCGWNISSVAPLSDFAISGDRVTFRSVKADGYFALNQSEKKLTGPFPMGRTDEFDDSWATVDPDGRLAVNVWRGASFFSGVFGNPAAPSPLARISGRVELKYCGRRLIGLSKRVLREYDPVSLAPIRVIGHGGEFAETACSGDLAYLASHKQQRTTISAFRIAG